MAPLLIDHGCRSSQWVVLLGLATFSCKVAHLPAAEAWEVAGRKLLWWPDCSLLLQWSRGTIELLLLRLLLLELSQLELWTIAPILLLLWSTQLTPRWGIHMRYLGGAPLELPLPADPGIFLFLFFSSASATAFIFLSLGRWLHSPTHSTTSWWTVPGAPADGWWALPSIGWPFSHPCRHGMTDTKQECWNASCSWIHYGSLAQGPGTPSGWYGADPQIGDVHGRGYGIHPMEHGDQQVGC
jgi:hypothetical protein